LALVIAASLVAGTTAYAIDWVIDQVCEAGGIK